MIEQITVKINVEKCTACGRCTKVCPARTLSLVDKSAKVTGENCIACGHCAATCPEAAILVGAIDPTTLQLSKIATPPAPLAPGDFDASKLAALMFSRRSCRSFSSEPIERALLEDLVKIGAAAPSATNTQLWSYTVLPDRAAVEKLVNSVAGFFTGLNKMAVKPAARLYARFFAADALGIYYRNYYRPIVEKLERMNKDGIDPFLYGASAAIIISSRPGATDPAADSNLAAENILLAAHAAGLGSCLIGFATLTLNRKASAKKMFGIAEADRVYTVVALGASKEKYERFPGRLPIDLRFAE